MANSIQSPRLRRPPPPPPANEEPFSPMIDNTIFTWLDTCQTDFEKFRKRFCKETPVHPQQWLFFEKDNECYDFIEKSVEYPKKVVLVTSGRLGQNLIENLHDCEQLDSIYIYCQDVEKYREFSQPYKKVLGVYSNPVELFSKLRYNLEKKSDETPTPTNNNRFFSNDESVERFSQPDIPWNPWDLDTCTKTLPVKGQSTIAVIQNGSIPFEIFLSNASRLTELHGNDKYSICLAARVREVTLGIYTNDQPRLLDRTDLSQYTIQSTNNDINEEFIYWIHFSKETSTVMYGVGEIRPKYKVLEARLDNRYANFISNISYLHVKINDTYQNFSTIQNLKDKIRFLIGSISFVEPNLLVLRQSRISLTDHANYSGISPLNLIEPCRTLYHTLVHFKLDDEDFPDFIQAIERSIQNPNGWCYQKLEEKANRYGRAKRELSYLRLTLDPIVIEIWPPGHYSPVHNHKNAYGMFRVLHGCILIRLFPSLSPCFQHDAPIEYSVHQDQVTWMLPRLNQTHQMKNVELNSSCIIIQCYSYDDVKDEKLKKNEEIFDYIVHNSRDIQTIKPSADLSFGAFKEKIRKEWDGRSSM